MRDASEIRAQGIATWRQVRERPLFLGYHNPFLRYAFVAFALVMCGVFTAITWGPDSQPVLLFFGIGVAFALSASYRSFMGERRIGALLAEVSADSLAIGCSQDRLVVPWSAIDVERAAPLESGLLALPLRRLNLASLTVETAAGEQRPWQREDYERFILGVHWNPDHGWLEIRSDPSEFVVHLMMLVHPMLEVMREEESAHATAAEAALTV